MGKCKDCKGWKRYDGPHSVSNKFGQCKKFDVNIFDLHSVSDKSDLVHLVFEEALDDVFIGPNFGCIHFERKET